MILEMWSKIGRRLGLGPKGSKAVVEQDLLLRTKESNMVVPLRESAVIPPMMVKKKDSAEIVSEAINKLVDRLEQINAGISLQTQQNIQLVDKISQLPDLLSSMPQQAQEQRQILQELTSELKNKSIADQKMLESVAIMTEQTSEQTAKLGQIEEHLQTAERFSSQLGEDMGRFNQSLEKLDMDTVSQTEWIQRMSQAFTATDRYLKYTLAQQQRRFIWMYAISMMICLVAVAGLVCGILFLSR